MTGREKTGLPAGATQSGVPGGGENTHSWRHREIVAAFESLQVTEAMVQADKFEQIARWWYDCALDFEHAVQESLAQAWSGAGADTAGSAVAAYLAQARDLTVALKKLPEVVRAAAEAIVATRYAIPPLAADAGTSMEAARAPGAIAAVGHIAAVWPPRGGVHDTGAAAAHGAASAAEETARTEMRQKYVTTFGELVGRIPLLPMPTRRFGAAGESGDRRLRVDDDAEETDQDVLGTTPASADPDRVMMSGPAPPGGATAVDRYFHCAGLPQASPDEGTVRGLPEYLITAANTRELLGVPRPAIAGGVIGGDELGSDEQRSPATRG